MQGHIDPKIKKQRVNRVIELEKEITNKFNNSFIGKDVEVLIERNIDGYSYGYSKQYIYCKIKGNYEIGEIINIKLESDMFCEYNGYLYYIIGDSIYRFDGDSEELYLELSSFKYYSNENWNKFAISNSGIYYMSDKKPKTLFMITNNM